MAEAVGRVSSPRSSLTARAQSSAPAKRVDPPHPPQDQTATVSAARRDTPFRVPARLWLVHMTSEQ